MSLLATSGLFCLAVIHPAYNFWIYTFMPMVRCRGLYLFFNFCPRRKEWRSTFQDFVKDQVGFRCTHDSPLKFTSISNVPEKVPSLWLFLFSSLCAFHETYPFYHFVKSYYIAIVTALLQIISKQAFPWNSQVTASSTSFYVIWWQFIKAVI